MFVREREEKREGMCRRNEGRREGEKVCVRVERGRLRGRVRRREKGRKGGKNGRECVCVCVSMSVCLYFFTFSLFHFFTFLLGHPRPSHLSRPSYHSSYPPLYCIQALTRTGEQVEESNSEKQTINKQTT